MAGTTARTSWWQGCTMTRSRSATAGCLANGTGWKRYEKFICGTILWRHPDAFCRVQGSGKYEMKFSICHTTIRPHGWQDAARAWSEGATYSGYEYVLCID